MGKRASQRQERGQNNALDQFNLVLSHLPQGLFWANQDGRILYVNKSLAEQLGNEQEELMELNIQQLDPHLSLFAWRKLWRRVKKEKAIQRETEFLTGKEELVPVKINLTYIEEGDEAFMLGVVTNKREVDAYKNILEITSHNTRIAGWELDLVKESFIATDEIYNILKLDKTAQPLNFDTFQSYFPVFLNPDQLKEFSRAMYDATRRGIPFKVEYQTKDLEGHPHWVRVTAEPIVVDESVVKVYGTMQDITFDENTNEFTILSKLTLSKATEMFFWVGENGSFKFVNDAVVDNLGYNKEELSRMFVWDVVKEISEEIWPDHFQSIKQQKNIHMETTQIRKDGGTHPVDTNLNYISFNGKEYICAIVRNIAKRKERDEMLYLNNETIEKAAEYIFWVEPTQARVLNVNQSICERLGYSKEELLNMHIYDFDPNATLKRYQIAWKDIKKNKSRLSETQFKTKSGELFDVEIRANYINYRGKELNCAFVRDITERKEKERKLRKAFQEIEKLKNRLEIENTYLQEEISDQHNFKNIISKSLRYKSVLRQVEEVANTDATVLITGETGTGKELLARAVHELSERVSRSLVKVNCAALPANLIESELFGHEKGAFTGAFSRKIGRFEMAHKGSIFLDEIGELPLELQAKLLRVLQEGEFERIGSNQTIKVDVRIIAATNRDLVKLIKKGNFREDLYYRLNVFPIENIPLRARKEDIPLLVMHFLKKFSGKTGKQVSMVSPTVMKRLVNYSYPGNVRELENIIERSVILSRGKSLTLSSGVFMRKREEVKDDEIIGFDEMQKKYIIKALKKCNWVVSGDAGAAKLLKLNPKTLESKMRKMSIKRSDFISS